MAGSSVVTLLALLAPIRKKVEVALISSALVSDAACTCILNEYYTKFHTYYSQIIPRVFRYLLFSKVIICPGLAWTSTLSL